MSNGVNFRQLALDLRSELTKCQRLNAELLEALEYCEDLLMRYEINRIDGEEISDSALIKIRAAIAKATGAA